MRGPLFYLRVRLAVAHELREQHSVGFSDANTLTLHLGRETIDAAVETVKATQAVASIGDGTILRSVLDFLKSDLGRALIRALVALLLM
jgi:hypothetical protein